MTDKTSKVVPLGVILGVILGGVLGAVIPNIMLAIDFIGQLFINALQVVVIPLILAAVISGVASFGNLSKVGRTGARILLYFLATSALAVVIGLALALIIRPGSAAPPDFLQRFGTSGGYPIGNISDMLAALIPFNLAAGIVKGQYLGLVLFAIFGGGLLATMGAGARTVTTFFRQLNDVLMKLVRLVLYAAPVGVFFLVGSAVASHRDSLGSLTAGFGWYALTILLGLAIQAFVVLPIIALRFAGRSPFDYFKSLSPALLTALGTGSSAATLPITYKCAIDDGKADPRAGALVLPLGSVANLNGTALSVVVATIFLANVFGVELSALRIILMTVSALLVSIGAAGVPMATPIIVSIVLGIAGFTPAQIVAGSGLIMALDWLIDRGRAFVNVWGDAVGAVVIAETFEFKTARRAPSRASDSRRESTRTPRGRTRGDGDRDRGRGRQDSRGGRKTTRGTSTGRTGRTARKAPEKPTPQERGGRGRSPQREPEPDSPFGISAQTTPALDIESGAAAPKEAARPDSQPDRQPQRGRSRDDSARGSGASHQKETNGGRDRSRGRRPERDSSDNQRSSRRSPSRERKPAAHKTEEPRPAQRREEREVPRREERETPRREEPDTPRREEREAPRREERKETPAEAEPKVKVETPEQSPEEAKPTSEPAISDGRLSPATVARELAKVSAQLAANQETELEAEEKPAERPAEKPVESGAQELPHKETPPDQPKEDKREGEFPRSSVAVKVSAPSSTADDRPKPAPEPRAEAAPEEKPAEPSTDQAPSGPAAEEAKPHFGRSRSRRGAKAKSESAPKPSGSNKPTEIPAGYSTESASFGRGKKKRVR